MGVVSNGTKRRSIGPIAGARDKGQSSRGEKRGGGGLGRPERERERARPKRTVSIPI
jgi:hypothetical protein